MFLNKLFIIIFRQFLDINANGDRIELLFKKEAQKKKGYYRKIKQFVIKRQKTFLNIFLAFDTVFLILKNSILGYITLHE